MRDCRKLLEKLKTKYREQFDFIKEKAAEKDKYFLGIRDNYLGLYYKGHRMAKIEVSNSKVTYSIAQYYVSEQNVNPDKMKFEEFRDNFNYITDQIDGHVGGKNKKLRPERVCQQWIMNQNNADILSDWYFLDMEYVQSRQSGRIDMIAVKCKADEKGKHAVALIELKVGTKADGGASGLIKHMDDFMKLLDNADKYNRIREELSYMISSYKELGLIDSKNELNKVTSAEQFAKKPDIYFLNYTYVSVPDFEGQGKEKLSSIKESFYRYLYDSDNCLEKTLKKEKIDGILKRKENFLGDLENSNIITCRQQIGEEDYRFIFQFIDPEKISPQWRCLE